MLILPLALSLVSGLFVGLSLGLTGSGGSLFAIPLLLFVVGLEMKDAVPISMLVVGLTALIGAVSAFKKNLLLTRPTLIFGFAGMLSAPLGLILGEITPETIRTSCFSMLAIIIAIRMGKQSFNVQSKYVVRAKLELEDSNGVCRFSPEGQLGFTLPCAIALGASGAVVGILSGFFGVGGGFLIVPALMYVIRMEMPYAIGSSLAIIAMIGLSGGAISGVSVILEQPSAFLFGVGSLLGMLSGRVIASKLAGLLLNRLFATALFITGTAMIVQIFGGENVI